MPGRPGMPHAAGAMFVFVAATVAAFSPSNAVEPADPDLIPEARRVLEYLHSIQGKKMLAGISGSQDAQTHAVLHITGRNPAISGGDMAGFHRKGGELYHKVLRSQIDRSMSWWTTRGGLVALQYHWMKPGNPDGSAWVQPPRGTGRLDLARAVTPGTEEHKAVMDDLKLTADYLQELAAAKVPVLWRPFHEIDGGWFWWTDPEKPENTAALWRLMFDYFTKERKLHNLIWVYNAAHVSHTRKPPATTLEEEIAHRKRYYPGGQWVDIASIDTYGNPKLGWGHAREDARRKAYEMMQQVAPGKMLAIAEDDALINPDIAAKEAVPWLYCVAWWAGGHSNPPDWMRATFNHDYYLTLDELPLLREGNVAPDVRIVEPSDGAALRGAEISFSGVASDRNGNLKEVTIHVLSGNWRNWFLRPDKDVLSAFDGATSLGKAELSPGGRWAFTWKNPPNGFHSVVAVARDESGAASCSNVVRVTCGLENLARGATASASSTSKWGRPAEAAIDGDPNTMWWSDKDQPDPQWIMIDLGAVRRVSAVSALWWKAYAKAYTVQVSTDGKNWQDAAEMKGRSNYFGDMDLLRFNPAEARYIRLHCGQRAVTWQAYTLFELGVYESLRR